jgi:hypothetical protein
MSNFGILAPAFESIENIIHGIVIQSSFTMRPAGIKHMILAIFSFNDTAAPGIIIRMKKIFLKNQLLSSISENPNYPEPDYSAARKSLQEVQLILKRKKISSVSK